MVFFRNRKFIDQIKQIASRSARFVVFYLRLSLHQTRYFLRNYFIPFARNVFFPGLRLFSLLVALIINIVLWFLFVFFINILIALRLSLVAAWRLARQIYKKAKPFLILLVSYLIAFLVAASKYAASFIKKIRILIIKPSPSIRYISRRLLSQSSSFRRHQQAPIYKKFYFRAKDFKESFLASRFYKTSRINFLRGRSILAERAKFGLEYLAGNIYLKKLKREFELRLSLVPQANQRVLVGLGSFLFVFVVASSFFLNSGHSSQAASYGWTQSGWAGGATSTPARHSNIGDRTGWVYYASSSGLTLTESGASLIASSVATVYASDTDFATGTINSVSVAGSGSGAALTLYGGVAAKVDMAKGSSANHICILRDSGEVYCSGYNLYGQSGRSSSTSGTFNFIFAHVTGIGGTGVLNQVKDIAVGYEFTCALRNEGTVYCWGNGNNGKLGDGSSTHQYSPIQVKGVGGTGFLTDIISIAAGQGHTCALKNNGTVYCWGENTAGQLGDTTNSTRVTPVQVKATNQVDNLTGIQSIAAGGNTSCAVSNGGGAYCWGGGTFGKLGNGATGDVFYPVVVKDEAGTGSLSNVSSIAVGGDSACAVKGSGQAVCWGKNSSGQLGDNTIIQKTIPTVVVSENGSGALANVVSISAGSTHACAINSSGTAYCWGTSSSGELGNSTWSQKNYPGLISKPPNQTGTYFGAANSIVAGRNFTCSLGNDRQLYCWGQMSTYGLGSTLTSQWSPLQVLSSEDDYLSSVSKIVRSSGAGCALVNSQVYCFGGNTAGQLGVGDKNAFPYTIGTPYPMVGESGTGAFTSVLDISGAISSNFYCAILSDHTVDCWGENLRGQLGNGTTIESGVPVKVRTPDGSDYLSGIVSLSAGREHVCAVKDDGTAYCWGSNSAGQLGNGLSVHTYGGASINYWPLPSQVKDVAGTGNLVGVQKITAGNQNTCAILSDTKAYCWGSGSKGAMGTGVSFGSFNLPVNVKDPTGTAHLDSVIDIDISSITACAVRSGGSVYCWGEGQYGQMGNNASTSTNVLPIQTLGVGGVGFLSSVASIKAGGTSVIAIKTDGTVVCWGRNSYGVCGDGSQVQRNTPVQTLAGASLGNFTNASKAALTSNQACLTKTDGTSYCWGYSNLGGTTDSSLYPQRVLGRSYFMSWKTLDYSLSGNYTSGIIDAGAGLASYGRLDFNTTKPAGTDIQIQLSASDDGQNWDAFVGPNGTSTYFTSSLPGGSFWPSSLQRRRYYKFKAFLSTSDVTVTPRLEDLTLSYHPAGWLTSSPYDSSSDGNLINGFTWAGTQTGGSHVSFQIRSAPDNSGSPGTWTSWCGPDDGDDNAATCDTNTFFSNPSGGEVVDDMFKDGVNDHWMQYRFFMESDNGSDAPSISSITLNYVVNMPPTIVSLSSSQQEGSGLINVNYGVMDADTDSGNVFPSGSRGYVSPTFDYSTDGGLSWNPVDLSYATITPADVNGEVKKLGEYNGNFGTINKVNASTSTPYTLAWDFRAQLAGSEVYSTSTRIRLNINDNEGANNRTSAISDAFSVDLRKPRVKLMIDSRSDATQTLSFVNPDGINDLDDNLDGLQFKAVNGTNLTLNDGNPWLTYASSSAILATWILNNGSVETVSFIMRDRFGNVSNNGLLTSVSTPEKPSNIIYQDVSTVLTDEWREFVAWSSSSLTPADFNHYVVYRAIDGGPFNLHATNTNINTNYILDASLNTNSVYHYRVSVGDKDGNYSNYSAEIFDRPDGQGGSDFTPPTISNVQIGIAATTTTQSATISWETDEPSNSTVKYTTSLGGNFSTSTGVVVSVMADRAAGLGQHVVTLTGLLPNTTYYFQVESMDPSENIGTSKLEPDGYSFSTVPGPVISGVSASEVSNYQATIEWQTDIPASSQVFYSLGSNFTPQSATGSAELTQNHQLTISGLQSGRTYHYYVQSIDGSGNEANDYNGGNYYDFHTTADTAKPIISNAGVSLLSDRSAVITWSTDKPANSLLSYRLEGGEYLASTTYFSAGFNTSHSVTLLNLSSSTKYYYRLNSTDQSNNVSDYFSSDFTTMERLLSNTEANDLANAARLAGQNSAGGSHITIGNMDVIPPTVNSINVSDISTSSAVVSWATNEPANSLVEYGPTDDYMFSSGSNKNKVNHRQTLFNLVPGILYYYQLTSIDAAGNLSTPMLGTFWTASSSPLNLPTEETPDATSTEIIPSDFASTTPASTSPAEQPAVDLKFSDILQRTIDFIKQAAKSVSLAVLEASLSEQQKNLRELSALTPAPKLSAGPVVKTWEDMAVITWSTDKKTNSLISFTEPGVSLSDINRVQVVGNPDILSEDHQVILSGLKPATTYNYQLRGATAIGSNLSVPPAQFTTLAKAAKVDNYVADKISPETASFKWVTSIPTDTSVRITPYRNNALAPDEARLSNSPKLVSIHEMSVNTFEPGVFYRVELFGRDSSGHILSQSIDTFSTTNQELPLLIEQVKTDSALTAGNPPQVQSIISWDTTRPATSKIYYRHGTGADNSNWTNETTIDKNYTRRHLVVMTDFLAGEVYQFQVESTDSNGKTIRSQTHTILTPRQQESVFQLIMNNIEQTFGWIGAVRGQ